MPDTIPNLNDLARRPQRYWNADGIPELTMGAVWLLWGIAFLVPQLIPHGSWLQYYWMVIPFILIATGALTSWVIKHLKQRLTYPRGGFVTFPEPTRAMRAFSSVLAAGVASGVVLLVMKSRSQAIQDLVSPIVAILLALGFLIPALRWRLPHYLTLSTASLILALYLAGARLPLDQSFIVLWLALGVVSCVLGALRLRSYIRHNPVAAAGGQA